MNQKYVIPAFAITLASMLALAPAAGQSEPDLAALKGAVAIVLLRGVVPSLGNAPVASQGTGFFVSKDGFLVTANHLRSDLGPVDEGTVTYELHFGPTAADIVSAAPVYVNPAADIMVLYAPVGDRNVPTLQRSDRTNVVPGTTSIYTVGYPAGYQYSVDKGIIKSFGGPIAPIPAWTTSLTFKVGQSGSPIVLANGQVIAVAKAVDKDATSIGLVIPIRLVPMEYWDGPAQPSSTAALALKAGTNKTFDRILVEALVKSTAAAARAAPFSVTNAPCADSQKKVVHIPASPGWRIDPTSIKVNMVRVVGSGAQVEVANRSPSGFDVAAQIQNIGTCAKIFGTNIAGGISASLNGVATYNEIPNTPQYVTVSDTAAIGSVKSPLPNVPISDMRFSVQSKTGKVQSFQPVGEEITKNGTQFVLDTGKVKSRLLGPQ